MSQRECLYSFLSWVLHEINTEVSRTTGDLRRLSDLLTVFQDYPLELEEAAKDGETYKLLFSPLLQRAKLYHWDRWLIGNLHLESVNEQTADSEGNYEEELRILFKALSLALVEIRYSSYSIGLMSVFELAHLIHNTPSQLRLAEKGKGKYTFAEILDELQNSIKSLTEKGRINASLKERLLQQLEI